MHVTSSTPASPRTTATATSSQHGQRFQHQRETELSSMHVWYIVMIPLHRGSANSDGSKLIGQETHGAGRKLWNHATAGVWAAGSMRVAHTSNAPCGGRGREPCDGGGGGGTGYDEGAATGGRQGDAGNQSKLHGVERIGVFRHVANSRVCGGADESGVGAPWKFFNDFADSRKARSRAFLAILAPFTCCWASLWEYAPRIQPREA